MTSTQFTRLHCSGCEYQNAAPATCRMKCPIINYNPLAPVRRGMSGRVAGLLHLLISAALISYVYFLAHDNCLRVAAAMGVAFLVACVVVHYTEEPK